MNKNRSKGETVYQLYGLKLVSAYPFGILPSFGSDSAMQNELTNSVFFACNVSPPFDVDWESGELIFSYHYPVGKREWRDQLYRFSDFYLWQFSWGADYYIQENRIDCHLHNPAKRALVEKYLIGVILAFWLEQRGIPCLHASAVVVKGQTLAFLAHSGNGKSTLAAGMIKEGSGFLTDDVVPVEYEKNRFWARSGFPYINLWKKQLSYLLSEVENDLSPKSAAKKYVPVQMISNGAIYHGAKALLAGIYIPLKFDASNKNYAIEIAPIPPSEAVIELARYSYIPPADTERLGWQGHRMEFFSRLVEQVPVRRLIFPTGFEYLPRVTEAVMKDLERLSR